jgi:hypothetical protein
MAQAAAPGRPLDGVVHKKLVSHGGVLRSYVRAPNEMSKAARTMAHRMVYVMKLEYEKSSGDSVSDSLGVGTHILEEHISLYDIMNGQIRSEYTEMHLKAIASAP